MFTSDKDLKGGRKSNGREFDLERARNARIEREKERVVTKQVIIVQRWFRGRISAAHFRGFMREDFSRKMIDIMRLKKLMSAQGVPFCVPPNVSFEMMAKILHFYNVLVPSDRLLLRDYARDVFLPLFLNSGASLNPIELMIHEGLKYRLKHFLALCLGHLVFEATSIANKDDEIASTLQVCCCLLGLSTGASDGGLTGLTTPPEIKLSESIEICLNFAVVELDLFSVTREALCSDWVNKIGQNGVDTCRAMKPSIRGLWQLAVHASMCKYTSKFIQQLLTIPMMPLRLGVSEMSLINSKSGVDLLIGCLKCVEKENWNIVQNGELGNFLPISPLIGCNSVVLLASNLVEMYVHMPPGAISVNQEIVLLTFLSKLLDSSLIPDGILTNNQAITLEKESRGTDVTATAVPQPIQQQMKLIVGNKVLIDMCSRLMVGIETSHLYIPTPSELEISSAADKVNQITMISNTLEVQRRQEGRWFGAKWADKLLSTISDSTNSTPSEPPTRGLQSGWSWSRIGFQLGMRSSKNENIGGLPNVTEESRAVAQASNVGSMYQAKPNHTYRRDAVSACVAFLSVLLRRWSWGSNINNPIGISIVNSLSFGPSNIIPKLWSFLLEEANLDPESYATNLNIQSSTSSTFLTASAVFMLLFGHALVVIDDSELYELNLNSMSKGTPFLVPHQLRKVARCFKHILFRIRFSGVSGGCFEGFLGEVLERALGRLHARTVRRALGDDNKTWIVEQACSSRVLGEIRAQTPRALSFLTSMPWSVTLMERMRVFAALAAADRAQNQPDGVPGIKISVRRGYVLEDGLAAMDKIRGQMRGRLQVVYTSQAGHRENGIDMGGLFKDFWVDLSRAAFDPSRGLFKQTKLGLLYPNPASGVLHQDHLRLFEFLGGVLGKALLEGITVQPEFATFFLGFMRGGYDFLNLFHDLAGLDEELYRNLIFLKQYDGDGVEDLCLNFTVTDDIFGATREVDLVPHGSNRPVTSLNRLEYVNRVAKHHLVDNVRAQSEAFVYGLRSVIPASWLQMFSEPELQILISGSGKGLDVDDLRRHTHYAGGFVGSADITVRRFWRVIENMDQSERSALLKFVTGCSRPPPLGFEALQPPFTVNRVPISNDAEKLPSASTCFNVLKLPTYSSERVMREKLLYSIFSEAGFELS